MKRIVIGVIVAGGLLAALCFVKSAHADSGAPYRIGPRGHTVSTYTNALLTERDQETSWPSHTPVNADLKPGERRDSLGRVHQAPGSSQARASVEVDLMEESSTQSVGAAGYRRPMGLDWHPPTAPFFVAGR